MRAEGVEPSQALRPFGFSYRLRLSPPEDSAFVSSVIRFLFALRVIIRRRCANKNNALAPNASDNMPAG